MTQNDTQNDGMADVERQTRAFFAWVRELGDEYSNWLLVGIGVTVLAQWFGVISLGLPSWWPIVPIVGGAAVVAGWLASDRLYSLIPEDEQIILVAFETTDATGGEIWSLHPDEFEDLEVTDGELYQWEEAPVRCYEVRSYDPETNTAVANWRETKPASALAEQAEIDDVLADIQELREMLEPEVRRARRLRRQLPGVVRMLDAERDKEVVEGMETATIDADKEDATVSTVLEDVLGEDLDPPAGGGSESDTDEKTNGHTEGNAEVEQEDFDAILEGPAVGEM